MALRNTEAVPQAVTLADFKAHLRIDHADEDSLLSGLLAAAQDMAEGFVQRRFGKAEHEWAMSLWPWRFPLAPVDVSSVVVSYVAEGQSSYTTLASSAYILRPCGQAVYFEFVSTAIIPLVENDHPAPIKAVFDAGYAAADLPQKVKTAIMMLGGMLYHDREGKSDMPAGVAAMLRDEIWV